MSDCPTIIILAGATGSGKTTAAKGLLAEYLELLPFANADEIARGLSPFDPEAASSEASQLMWQRIESLSNARESFALETSLAGRSYADWIQERINDGYFVCLLYFWLKDPELNVRRVAERVADGGHHVPEPVIRDRYRKSLRNFVTVYNSLALHWTVIDNSNEAGPAVAIAHGENDTTIQVFDHDLWMRFTLEAADEQ